MDSPNATNAPPPTDAMDVHDAPPPADATDAPPPADGNGFVVPKQLTILLHQCTRCQYTSTQIQNMRRHVAKCENAEIVSATLPAYFEPPAAVSANGGSSTAINGNHNTANNTTNIHITILPPAADYDDGMALIRLFQRPDVLMSLSVQPAQNIPAVLLGYLRGAEAAPENKTVSVKGDRVIENGRSMPRRKFVKKTIGETIEACTIVDPDATPDPEAMRGVKSDLNNKVFEMGRRGRASKYDALKMYSLSSADFYRMGTAGREFVDQTVKEVDRELTFLAM